MPSPTSTGSRTSTTPSDITLATQSSSKWDPPPAGRRPRDFVGRFGGDEFVVLFRDLPSGVRPETLVDRIRTALDQPWPELGTIAVTASVGVVDSHDGVATPDEMMRAADTAMYSRKHGTEATESPKLMTSRALAHHRAAMDGLGGGFCVLRRVASRDDWVIVEANRRVREAFAPVCGDTVGMLLSEVNQYADNSNASRALRDGARNGDPRRNRTRTADPGRAAELAATPRDTHRAGDRRCAHVGHHERTRGP